MARTFHLFSIKIGGGIPIATVEMKAPNTYGSGVAADDYTIDELKEAVLAFTRALHMAEQMRDHCAKCDKCTFEALGGKTT